MEKSYRGVPGRVADNQGIPFRPSPPEYPIVERKLAIERKTFVVAIAENHQGRFCRVTEHGKNARNAIIIPASGLTEFAKILDEMLAAANSPESPDL